MSHRVGMLVCLSLAVIAEPGCKKVPQAELANHDVVEFVRANRGHEVVVRKGGRAATIRLVGLYAFDPTIRHKDELETFADLAVTHLNKKYRGKELTVMLEQPGRDPRDRYIGFLYEGDEDIGLGLLREGVGAVYTEYPWRQAPLYFAAEKEARDASRGIWAGTIAVTRLRALRATWDAAHLRHFGDGFDDPWMHEDVPGASR